ncbi:hypothetical protein [Roseiconus lacunae]|uniref:PXPV repeat-containing protein n=1 Tax=Roseiconus lacunae TaxID=2605694 RepID=A0ABT7PQF9_9BACT|nr:hypothetical protein [Roseiconus lacunae]MCD0463437.1 hypothetical protein [Roseiconus lacunae]MDM4018745.1 hypothetical protein [Roseiconus lacunae]WRQ48560.1 hypothetical protein U8335_16475 [Stieleria sp. HD01]
MKRFVIALALLATFAIANETHAQYVTLRVPTVGVPAVGVPVAPAVYPYTSYRYGYAYAPAPVIVQQPVIAPVMPVPVMRRPAYMYYSPYGGTEVRVPGQPVANTLRAIIP